MALFQLKEKRAYTLGIWKIEETEEALRNALGRKIMVPHSNPGKKIEYLAVRILSKKMNIDPANIAYEVTGKPYLLDQSHSISISHTKGYVAVVLSQEENIGTDIEIRSDRIKSIRSRYMHPAEEVRISSLKGEEETCALLLHWSAKEALFKAIPDTDVHFKDELRIENFAFATCGQFRAKALRSEKVFLIDFLVEKDFVSTVCFPEK